MAWASRRITSAELLRNWGLVYVGNAIGALGTVVLVLVGGVAQFGDGAVREIALAIGRHKAALGVTRGPGAGGAVQRPGVSGRVARYGGAAWPISVGDCLPDHGLRDDGLRALDCQPVLPASLRPGPGRVRGRQLWQGRRAESARRDGRGTSWGELCWWQGSTGWPICVRAPRRLGTVLLSRHRSCPDFVGEEVATPGYLSAAELGRMCRRSDV